MMYWETLCGDLNSEPVCGIDQDEKKKVKYAFIWDKSIWKKYV